MLDGRVDVNARNSDNETALYAACQAQHWDIAELLLQQPDIDTMVATVSRGDTALLAAAAKLHLKTACCILERGCKGLDWDIP